jgi:hypothetical protein
MELYEEFAKYGIPDVKISVEEWEREYDNTYSILSLNNSTTDKILAAEDIIAIYLLLQAQGDKTA